MNLSSITNSTYICCRFKAQQMMMEQDLHNRDEAIRGDHGEMMWERDLYQQNQIVARARQQMLLQRDMLNDQENEASKRRMQIYNQCYKNALTCGPDVKLSLPEHKPKMHHRSAGADIDKSTSPRSPPLIRSPTRMQSPPRTMTSILMEEDEEEEAEEDTPSVSSPIYISPTLEKPYPPLKCYSHSDIECCYRSVPVRSSKILDGRGELITNSTSFILLTVLIISANVQKSCW